MPEFIFFRGNKHIQTVSNFEEITGGYSFMEKTFGTDRLERAAKCDYIFDACDVLAEDMSGWYEVRSTAEDAAHDIYEALHHGRKFIGDMSENGADATVEELARNGIEARVECDDRPGVFCVRVHQK
jgi:hypothetical protein